MKSRRNAKTGKARRKPPKGHMRRMSEARAASGKLGGRPRRFRKPRPGWNSRTISRLARNGVERPDIARVLAIGGMLTGDAARRVEFDRLVEDGHSEFRVQLQAWLCRSAAKGRSNAIKALAEAWLERFQEDRAAAEWDKRLEGFEERAQVTIGKVVEARLADGAARRCEACGEIVMFARRLASSKPGG